MLHYETLILSNTHITKDELFAIEDYFDKLTSAVGGRIRSFDKWGKYRLAFPVKKNDYGIYTLIRFEVPKENATTIFKDLDSFLKIKCNEIVLRSVTIKLDKEFSLDYKRPESVDGRSGNLDTFLKENKMEGILNSDVSDNKKTEEVSVETQSSEVKSDDKDVNAEESSQENKEN
jgi:small subunit ribosomal protein S6